MEKIYVVFPFEGEFEEEEDEAVAFCSRADAEEYALSIAEEQAYESFLSCINWDDLCERRDFMGYVEDMKRYSVVRWGNFFETTSGMLLTATDPYIKEIVKL